MNFMDALLNTVLLLARFEGRSGLSFVQSEFKTRAPRMVMILNLSEGTSSLR